MGDTSKATTNNLWTCCTNSSFSLGSFFSDPDAPDNNELGEDKAKKNTTTCTNDNDLTKTQQEGNWNSFFSSLMSDNNDANKDGQNDAMVSLMDSWIQKRELDTDIASNTKGIAEIKAMMDLYGVEVKRVGASYFGGIAIQNLGPASFHYYLEREDEVKNPSWKCRQHRFHTVLKVDEVVQLNTYFHFADLAYVEDRNQINDELARIDQHGEYELFHCKTRSEPHEPAFYAAVKKGTLHQKNGCEILLAIRGTASVEDVITDVLCENVEYKKGRAHKGILESGKNIVKQFQKVLDEFVQEVGIRGTVNLLVVGHSLGGGAACIVGFELQDVRNLNVRVVGFGTPAVVSKELGEKADYITTVVCDSDCIPRSSGETVVNVVLDVMENDWIEKAKLDADLMLKDFQSKNSWLMSDAVRQKSMDRINTLLDGQMKPTIRKKSTKRMEVVLFPPGRCIHLWRDGVGISASVVPGTFFDSIDITRTMVSDHLCASGYGAMFLELMRQHHKDPHFRFE